MPSSHLMRELEKPNADLSRRLDIMEVALEEGTDSEELGILLESFLVGFLFEQLTS